MWAAFFYLYMIKLQIMKTVMALFLSAFILLSPESVKSQNVVPNSEFMLDKLRLNKVMHGIKFETYETTTGDPFLYKDFHSGKITMLDGEKYQIEMRYDIYADQVQLLNDNHIYVINHPEKLASIVIDTLCLVYCNFANSPGGKNSSEGSYFILRTVGNCKLLIKKNIRVQDAELPKLLQEGKPAKFVHLKDTYYLKFDGRSAVKIDSRKDLIRQLSDKQDEVYPFINENHLSVNNVEDLIRVVSFYNGLQ